MNIIYLFALFLHFVHAQSPQGFREIAQLVQQEKATLRGQIINYNITVVSMWAQLLKVAISKSD